MYKQEAIDPRTTEGQSKERTTAALPNQKDAFEAGLSALRVCRLSSENLEILAQAVS